VQFARPDGAGFRFVTEFVADVDKRNPQVAARVGADLDLDRAESALGRQGQALRRLGRRHIGDRRIGCRPCGVCGSNGGVVLLLCNLFLGGQAFEALDVPCRFHGGRFFLALACLRRDELCAGSFIVLSHVTADGRDADTLARITDAYSDATAPLIMRSRAEITRFFAGFELVEPGIVFLSQWRPTAEYYAQGGTQWAYAGVGRKARPE